MARIYIARSTGIGAFERHVVLKMITPERANDQTAVSMFLDEARLAASLNHHNVAQVFEVGEDAGIHYLAMEYVHGQDLRALLAKAGAAGTRMPIELALIVASGTAAGLHHAHERRGPDGQPLGIVHRDVSPSNIMVGYDGAVKLLDFGIAKAAQRSVETQSGVIKGKFAYMAPEQCRGRGVDRRSDVFSLGIILYEITTQHRCFRADSDFDTMHRIVTGDVVRPTRVVPGYPPALEAIIMTALASDPSQRYQSAGAVLEAIESFATASHMPMTTMGLGRFMRDMFGDVPEPWLAPASSAPNQLPLKESTVSSTDGRGTGEGQRAPTPPPVAIEPPVVARERSASASDALEAAATVLDLPRGSQERIIAEHEEDNAAWDARAYPTAQPSVASTTTLPPSGGLQVLDVVRAAAAMAPQVPAIPAPDPTLGVGTIPNTRLGYASGQHSPARGDVSLGAPPIVDDELELRPNRRGLFVGIGVVAVGVAALLLVAFTGNTTGTADEATHVATTTRTAPTPIAQAPSSAPAPVTRQSAPASPPEPVAPKPNVEANAPVSPGDEDIAIHIYSTPARADVLLDGAALGKTPLDAKRPRGVGTAQLVVRLAGYQEVTSKIDLGSSDFSKTVALKKLEPNARREPPAKRDTTSPAKRDATPSAKRDATPSAKHDAAPPAKHDATPPAKHDAAPPPPPPPPPAPPKPKCQPPGQYNPFDTDCDGKPCPACK
jgi:serine/threonine-protein kinase